MLSRELFCVRKGAIHLVRYLWHQPLYVGNGRNAITAKGQLTSIVHYITIVF